MLIVTQVGKVVVEKSLQWAQSSKEVIHALAPTGVTPQGEQENECVQEVVQDKQVVS